VISPGRARRPGAARPAEESHDEAELDSCPFCEGREDRTPPETFRVGSDARWIVRVVPNLYPAFERQEVVVHTPRHVRTFAELTDEELDATATAWRERTAVARAEGYAYVHALVNEGREAGASLPHSHSQLVWLRDVPPAVASENAGGVRELLGDESLWIGESDGAVTAVHRAGRLPYELLIAAREPGPLELSTALRSLRSAIARLRALEGALPWNAWLHEGPHPHLELVPRLSVQAGVELGAGIAINTIAPEDAAAALRAVKL
jgi:UDPglucose--hexose-1-phosphate uridylyltransferase